MSDNTCHPCSSNCLTCTDPGTFICFLIENPKNMNYNNKTISIIEKPHRLSVCLVFLLIISMRQLENV